MRSLLWACARSSSFSASDRAVAALAPTMVYFIFNDEASRSETTTGTVMLGTTSAWCIRRKN